MKETDLYQPVKDYFEAAGYTVQGEVKHCDLVAQRGDEPLVIVELKTSPNLGLLVQATDRQAISECVYVAVPKKKYRRNQWRGIQRVIKQLGLGLLVVSTSKLGDVVTELFAPTPMRKIQARKKKAVLNEVNQRQHSYNVGGATRTELITAYKQNAILTACFLDHLSAASAANLRKLGAEKNTYQILSSNHYGWFEKVERGIYTLTKKGKAEPKDVHEQLWHDANNFVRRALASEASE